MRRLWLLLPFLLAACATLPLPDKAQVILYRRALPLAPPMDMAVYDGSRVVGALQDGSYLRYYASPGPRVFRAVAVSRNSIPYGTTLKAGQTYYLMVYSLGDQSSGDIAITPIDQATAATQIAGLKPAAGAP